MTEPATTLLAIAAAAYALAFLLTVIRLWQNREPTRNLNYAIILFGWIMHSWGLWLRGLDAGSCPIRNPFEVLQFVSWSVLVIYLFTGKVFRLSLFGSGCAVLALLLSTGAFLFTDPHDLPLTSSLGGNPWIESHAALALFSYGVFGLLAVVSGLYLLQNYSLKRKRRIAGFRFLPPILDMELVMQRLLYMACVVFSVAMGLGMVHWIQAGSLLDSVKLVFSVLLWVGYLVALLLHWLGRLYGQRMAQVCFVLFVMALANLWPVESGRAQAAPTESPMSMIPAIADFRG